ncbi:MAG: HAMP domain-containing histidine kinase, partial [Acidimicrobiia bacterium]|nr:HAMP domain-containing histidine kinase [Acidimicrobiia bacterium]
GVLAILFVRGRRVLWAAIYGVFVATVGVLWGLADGDGWLVAYTMTASYAMGVLAVLYVVDSAIAIDARLGRVQDVLDSVPVALHEEDFSGLVKELAELRKSGVTDIRRYVETNPEELQRLMGSIQVIAVNRAAGDLFGVEPASLIGPVRVDAQEGRNRAGYLSDIIDVWEGRDARNRQFFDVEVNGRRLTLALEWVVPLEDTDRTTFVALSDVTEIIEARDALSQLNRSKDAFVAAISHELRTPLTAVLGFGSELLHRSDELSSSERRDMLSLIVGQSQAMAHIVEDLLVSARADIGAVSIAPAMHDLIGHCRGTVEELGMRVEVRASGDATAYVDAVRFRQIIRNLLTNAERYGGKRCWIEIEEPDDVVVVTVNDDGPGVPPEMADRIFDTFVSAHAPRAATASVGLGLSVSRFLARCMGGDLVYRSDGMTSSFVLTVPTSAPPDGDEGLAVGAGAAAS